VALGAIEEEKGVAVEKGRETSSGPPAIKNKCLARKVVRSREGRGRGGGRSCEAIFAEKKKTIPSGKRECAIKRTKEKKMNPRSVSSSRSRISGKLRGRKKKREAGSVRWSKRTYCERRKGEPSRRERRLFGGEEMGRGGDGWPHEFHQFRPFSSKKEKKGRLFSDRERGGERLPYHLYVAGKKALSTEEKGPLGALQLEKKGRRQVMNLLHSLPRNLSERKRQRREKKGRLRKGTLFP